MFRLALFVAPALAWGPDGHATIAEIAQGMLSAEANKTLAEIAGEGTMIADHSSWPDVVRKDDPENFGWSGGLHFLNIPSDTCAFDYERDCTDDFCVVGALNNYTARMMDTELSQLERFEALKFVVHFVGDLHQPMHTGRSDDQGGNLIKVNISFADRKESNLHKVWDEKMIDDYEKPLVGDSFIPQAEMDRSLLRREYWTPMYQNVLAELQEGGEYFDSIASYTTECVKNGVSSCLNSFAGESTGIACSKAYTNEVGDEVLTEDTLTQAYADSRMVTTQEQFAKAAVRLSYILETTLTASTNANDASGMTAWLALFVTVSAVLMK